MIDECGTIQKAVYLANISRAFKFLEFALDYEGKVEIPKKFPERNIVSHMQPDEFENIMRK